MGRDRIWRKGDPSKENLPEPAPTEASEGTSPGGDPAGETHNDDLKRGVTDSGSAAGTDSPEELRAYAAASAAVGVSDASTEETQEESMAQSVIRYAEEDRQEEKPHEAPERSDKEEPVDTDLVERAVRRIVEIAGDRVEPGHREIGQLVLKDFFGMDLGLALSKDSKKPVSFTALCKHKEVPYDARELSSWVRAAALLEACKQDGVDVEPLRFSHFIQIVSLKDESKRMPLVLEAIEHGLSVRQTRDRVTELNRSVSSPGRMNHLIRRLKDPRSLVEEHDLEGWFEDEFLSDGLTKAQRLEIRTQIEHKRTHLRESAQLLDRLEEKLAEIDL
jgi:hypothetical protein